MAETYETPQFYGVVAEFREPETVIHAAEQARAAGYTKLDAYTPFPVHGLAQALGFRRNILPFLVFLGGMAGVVAGFGLQFWAATIAYPMNIGGRPLNSWPAFIPVTFEMGILLAAFTAVFGMIALNGLPMPYHPVFNVERFKRASQDRFFLAIEASDPRFDREATKSFLKSLGADEVSDVEN